MKLKWLIIIAVIFLISATAVTAADNQTTIKKDSEDVKLEKTHYYDEY